MKTSFKQDCLRLLADYRLVIGLLSLDLYNVPYNKLPPQAQIDIKAAARRYAQAYIDDYIKEIEA